MTYSTLLCVSLCLLTTTASLDKRSSSRVSITPLSNYSQDNFQTSIAESLSQVSVVDLQRLTIVHTQDDFVTFINGSQTQNLSISATLYQNLKVVSHLPVSAVSLLLPELLDSGGSISSNQLTTNTRNTLQQFREQTENLSSLIDSTSIKYFINKERQQEIVREVLCFLNETLDEADDVNITVEYLMTFTEPLSGHLRANSRDAVLDYLTCLHDLLSSLNISEDTLKQELVVILPTGPFSQTGSFLYQYYEQLLSIELDSSRLILRPNALSETLFSTTLYQTLSRIFYGDSLASIHDDLSQAASDIICSNDLQLYSCFKESTVVGFHTRLEKGYVVIMMAFGGCAVLFGIVLACIMYENKLINTEMNSQETQHKRKLDGPNVFTPVNSLQDFSLEAQLTVEATNSLLNHSDST